MNTINTDLNERECKVLVGYKRLGGRGNLNDVRKEAGVERGFGTPLENKLMRRGLLKKYQWDDYGLTSEGYEIANRLIQIRPLLSSKTASRVSPDYLRW